MMRKRFAFLGVLALVLVLVFPGRANAIDFMPKGVIYQGDVGNGNYGAVVAAYNQYDAACYVLGKNPDSISATIKQKLSDPNYGGRFYDYAQSFFTQSGMLEDVPGWVPTYIVWGSELMDLTLSDYQSVWYSTATKTGHDDALEDLVRILLGEDLGGGSGGGSGGTSIIVGDYFQVDLHSWRNTDTSNSSPTITATNATIDSDGVLTVGTGTTIVSSYVAKPNYCANARVYLSHSVVEFANSLISQGNKVVFSHAGYIVYAPDLTVQYGPDPGGGRESLYYLSSPSGHVRYCSSEHSTYYYDGMLFCFANAINGNPTDVGRYVVSQYLCDPISTPFDTPPSGVWPEPETPVTPDPPEVPTPTAPTETVDPDPTAPTITWPTAPTLVLPTAPIVVETPEGIDYTELLTLINDNLNSIDAYLQNFYTSFNSFRSDFLNGVDDIVDGLRNIYQYLGHLNNILEVHCKHITDQIEESVYNLELYLKRLFEWLPRQLDFDAEYDDSAVTALLRRILNKIPGGSSGPVTYKPNPQSDEPSFWDWLADLFNRILQKLLDLLPDEMIQLGQLFGELINLFPFSIPWDLFALLALFGHEPVTPVIDIPWGFGGSSGQVIMIRIDLHAWDGVAEMVRPVFLVLFCLQLALLSRDLLKIINVKSGGE